MEIIHHYQQKETTMIKFTRYEFDHTFSGGTAAKESVNGSWVSYYEVQDEIKKLEAEIQRLKVKSGETATEVKTKKRVNEWSNWRETGR
jgi:hypothetical protein